MVLADHWPDMAAGGFVANRVFDAVAAGARVVSDDVPGLGALFGDAVRVARTADDLRAAYEALVALPADPGTAAAVATRHSFLARAEVLLRDARDLLAQR